MNAVPDVLENDLDSLFQGISLVHDREYVVADSKRFTDRAPLIEPHPFAS
jgi:hypothetical protein